MNTSNLNSSSFRFLLFGGWTAIKSATGGSIFAVFVTLTVLAVFDAWQNGFQTIEFNGSEMQNFLSSAALLSLLAILLSVLPACIGGMVLAWLLKRNHSAALTLRQGKLKLGALIGACAGIVLTLLVLIPSDLIGRTAHGGFGYNPLSTLPIYILYAIEIIGIATVAGIWTDSQLRKYLEAAQIGSTG